MLFLVLTNSLPLFLFAMVVHYFSFYNLLGCFINRYAGIILSFVLFGFYLESSRVEVWNLRSQGDMKMATADKGIPFFREHYNLKTKLKEIRTNLK